MKRCWRRVLSVVLVLSLVLGMSSAAMAEDESSTTSTVDIELEIGDTVTYTVSDSVTESDLSSIDSDAVTATLESDTGVYADGSAYRLYFTSGDTTYYLTFSVSDEALTIGTTTESSSATEVTYTTDSYLTFTSGETTWYLNNTDGSCLSASAEASTAWSYDTTKGFYCTVDSVVYYLAEFAAYSSSSTTTPADDAPDGTTLIGYKVGNSGSYKLSVTIDGETNYVVLSYDTDASSLSTSLTTTYEEATTLYFDTSGYLYFQQDVTTTDTDTDETTTTTTIYYLDINPSAGALVIEISGSRSYAAAWLYDYQYGFCCQKTNKYYLKLQTTTSDDSTTYSLALSTSSSEENGLSFLDASTVSANTFYLSYALGGSTSTSTSTCYLKFSSGSSDIVGLTGSTDNATALSYAGGYLYFTEDDVTWYLCLASDGKLGVTKDQDSATQVSYKLFNKGNWAYGFTFAAESSSSNPRYLAGTDILAESVSERKTVTFEGTGIGTTSVTVDGITYNITVYTQIITIFTGDENIVGLTGEYSDDDLTVADSSIATASTSSTTIYSAASSVTKGSESAFKIVYETNGVEFFFLFDVSSGALTTGTTTDYGDAADVMWTSEGYLCFTGSDGTTYYLNVDSDGSLTAETSGSTVWSYESDSFSTTVDSSEVTLFSLLAATYPDGQNLIPSFTTEGVYTLGYTTTTEETDDDENTTTSTVTTYITYSVSDGTLTVGTSDESGTEVTYTSEGYLCFTGSDGSTYYLNVDSDGTLTADTDGSTVWSYDPSAGFLCTVDGTTYYLTESGAAEASDSVSILTEETANAFKLGYSTESWDFYLTWSSSVIGISTSSSLSLTYTTDGYIKFNSYYLSLADGVVSVTTDSSAATAWSYDPENGFYVTDSSGTHYLTEFRAFTINGVTAAEAYSSTSETAGTAISITGVAEGNITVTVTDSNENTAAIYKVYVIDNSDFVTSATTPFLSSSTTITSTSSDYTTSLYGTNSTYKQVSVTSLFLSVGLSYAITLDTTAVSSGGTWTLGGLTAAAGETVSDGTASVTVSEDGLTVTITGVSKGSTTLTYTVDGTSYTMPVTIKDYWGYDSSTTVRVHEYYMTEVTDTSAYMGVLYGETNSTVENVDFVEVTEGEVIFISFPKTSASACDFFGTPDEGYALTLLGSTNSSSHYMALDSDSPEETEFITLQTAAGYNQVYYFGAAAVLSLVQAALDMDADGGMGFTRVENATNNTSAITVRSQKLPTVTKQIAYVKRNGEQIEYETGMAIQTGDVVYYLITVTQYATDEAITYTDVILTDTISVTHYLSFSYDSSSGSLTTEATTDSDSASTVQADDSGYLYFTQDSTTYYLYVNSSGDLAATTAQSDAVTWTYDDSTGFSCTVDSVTWYLSETGVSTSAPGTYQLVTAYLDGEAVTELHTGSGYLLGYEDTTDRNAYFTSTATNTKDITDDLKSDTLDSDTEYYYYVYYTVVEDDTDEVLTNTVTLSYNYTSQYSSATLSSSADADASLSISQDQLTVTKNVDTTYYAQMTQVTSLSYSGLSLVSDSTKEFTALEDYYYPDGDASDVTTNYWPVYYTLTSEADSSDSTTTNYTATFYYTTDGGETFVKTGQTMTMTGVASASDGTVTLTLPTTSIITLKDSTYYTYSDSEDWKLYKSSDQAIDDDDVSSALASIDFVFTLYKYDSTSKTYVTVPNENYTIYENGEITGTGTTDSNGSFTLQDGQTAIFYSVDLNDENTSYYVLEDLNYLKAYNWLTTVTERTSAEDAEITFTELDSSYDMSKYRVSDTVTLTGDDAVSDSIYYIFENQYVYETTPVLDLTGDQIVLDYGLPVVISMRDNDIISYVSGDYTLSVALLDSDGKEYSSSNTDGMAGSYGTATLSDDGDSITYKLTQDLTGVETVCYQVTLTPTSSNTTGSTVTDTAEIQIMPATQMYYEEDFGSTVKVGSNATAHSLIQYSDSDSNSASWSTVYNSYNSSTDSGSSTTATLKNADATSGDESTTSYSFTQEEGRVGDTSDSVYGADTAYSADAYDSENHAKKVDVSENPAAFRYYFTGTGTTIYGRTSEDTAYISVKITYEGGGTVKCTDPEGTEKELSSSSNEYYTWYIDTRNVAETSGTTGSAIYGGEGDDATLYNIPVFDVSDLPYGKWKVYVYVYEAGTEVNYVYKTSTTDCYSTGYYAYVKSYTDLDGVTKSSGYQEIYTDGTNLYIKSQAEDYTDYGILLTFGSSGIVTEDGTEKYRVYEYKDGTYTERKVASSTLKSTITSNTKASLYLPVKDSNKSGKYFYLDGVRVYDPAGTSSKDNSDYTLCAAAYASDGESNTVVLNLRDKLVNSTDTTTSSLTDAFATLTDIGSNFSSAELYEAIGPNNELYLSSATDNGNALTFYMLNWDLNEYQIYLGMKAPDGDPVTVSVCDEEITVANSTDQYYDISSYVTYTALDEDDSESSYAATVTISATEGLVSLTDIKVTGTSAYKTVSTSSSVSESSLLELLTSDTLVFASSYVFSDADISSLIQSSQQDESIAESAEAAVEAEEDSSDASDTGSGSSSGSEDDAQNDAEDVTDSSGDDVTDSSGDDVTDSSGDDAADSGSEETAGTEDDGTTGITPASGTAQKKKQKITVKKASLKKTVRYKKLKKKKQSFKIKASAKGGAKLTFKKLSGNKKIKVSKKGKVTVKKGLKRGTYKVKVRISAAKTSKYKKASVTKTITIKIK